MFSIGSRHTTDIETAMDWHRDGKVVLVRGSVTATRAGKQKILRDPLFEQVARLREGKWRIETENLDMRLYTIRPGNGSRNSTYHCPEKEKRRKRKAIRAANSVLQEFGMQADPKLAGLSRRQRNRAVKRGALSRRKKGFFFDRGQCREKLPDIWRKFDELKELWKLCDKKDNTIRAYHGTCHENVDPIFRKGFRLPWRRGMLGRGIYVGPASKAKSYSDGIVLVVEVILGNCKELEEIEDIESPCNKEYDSMHLGAGRRRGTWSGWLANEEWVIRNPDQLKIVGIQLKDY